MIRKGETIFIAIPGRHHREMMPRSTKMELKGRKKMMEGIHIPKAVENLAWCKFNFGGSSRVRVGGDESRSGRSI